MAKRRLADLYIVGKEIEFDDGATEVEVDEVTGEEREVPLPPIKVYLKKLNPVDQEFAIRKANSARARVLLTSKDSESDEYAELLGQALNIGEREELINYLNAMKLVVFENAVEAELAAEEEWSKDSYISGLQDAWENDGLKEKYALDPEDVEAKRVFDEMSRFAAQVKIAVDRETERLTAEFEKYTDLELQEKIASELVSMSGDSAWVREYRKCEVWLSVREPDNHRKRYFEDRDEIDWLAPEILNRLIEEYRLMTVDPTEGKDLRGTDVSSASSEPPAQEETSSSSGPESVPA